MTNYFSSIRKKGKKEINQPKKHLDKSKRVPQNRLLDEDYTAISMNKLKNR